MIRTELLLYKILLPICFIPFFYGCASEKFILQKKDLAPINDRLAVLKQRLDFQSSKMEKLLDRCNEQKQLLTKSKEENIRSFEHLESLINQKHNKTYSKLAGLQQSNDFKPQPKPSFEITGTNKLLVGRIEKVRLTPPNSIFHARIDTGATTSSLDARDIVTFERDGNNWVRFKIKDPNTDNLYEIEKPIIRRVKILQASTNEADRRPVVKLQSQIGRIKIIEEFTLENRAHLDYQILVGRNILQDLMIVDVGKKFITTLPKAKNNKAVAQ